MLGGLSLETNKKLEVFRKLYCLGWGQVKEALKLSENDVDHFEAKYIGKREEHGGYGNIAFLLELDLYYANLLLNYIGFPNDPNAVDFIKKGE